MSKAVIKIDLQGENVGEKLEKLENDINLGSLNEYFKCSKLQDVIEILIKKMYFMAMGFKEHNILGCEDDYFKFSFDNSKYIERFGSSECIFDLRDRSLTIINYNKSNRVYCIHRQHYEAICPIIEVLSEEEFEDSEDLTSEYDYTIFTSVEQLKSSNLYITSEYDFNKFIKIIEYSYKWE